MREYPAPSPIMSKKKKKRRQNKFKKHPSHLSNVNNEARIAKRMKIQHISERSIRNGRTENWPKNRVSHGRTYVVVKKKKKIITWNVVFGAPIVDRTLVLDFEAQLANQFAWAPNHWILCLGRILLFFQHGVQNGHDKLFKFDVVIIGNQ